MSSPETRERHARRPWRAVAVATAAVLALLSFSQVVGAGALLYAIAALLYAAGALAIGQGRVAGFLVVALPSAALVLTQAWTLIGRGVDPVAYSSAADFLLAVLGLPLAALNLIAAVRELGARDR
jgi:apolipoprotein N-acyltransferase